MGQVKNVSIETENDLKIAFACMYGVSQVKQVKQVHEVLEPIEVVENEVIAVS